MVTRARKILLAGLIASAILGAGSASASAATQWVALTGSVGANTSCSSPGFIGVPGVQDAINAATSGDTVHICAGTWNTADTSTGGGFDIIDKALTIEGEGQAQTILDGSGRTLPVIAAQLTVRQEPPETMTVRSLTIRDGLAEDPGAISVYQASLLMEDVTVQNSTGDFAAVGVGPLGESLVIRRSTLIGQAAGAEIPSGLVFSHGPTTIEDSTLRDNVADDYAGITLFDPGYDLTVDGSTFSGLQGACSPAISNYNGQSPTGGEVRVTNSTISGNTIYGSKCYTGVVTGQDVILNNVTVADNAIPYGYSELFGFSTLEIGNSIIAADSPSSLTCMNWPFQPGTMANDGGNVISDVAVGCDDFVGGASPSLQTKVLESAIELGPLADNGGPTETMALGAASVARGAAIKAECPEDDQRGVTRGTPCTSGAWQEGTSGKPKVKQKGRAGKDSLTVRVRCADSGPCRIRLSGVLKGGKGKLKPKTVKVRAGGKTVELPYTSLLERELRSKGGSGSVRVRAKQIGGGSASTLVRVSLPDSVTG